MPTPDSAFVAEKAGTFVQVSIAGVATLVRTNRLVPSVRTPKDVGVPVVRFALVVATAPVERVTLYIL
jgi:hypothetical protein